MVWLRRLDIRLDDRQPLLDVNDDLAHTDPEAATLVKLRFFGGMTMTEAAQALGISVRGAHALWAYARSWLRRRVRPQ